MKREWEYISEFWAKKLKGYEKEFALRNKTDVKTNPDMDMQFIFDELKKRYDEDKVDGRREVYTTKKKTHIYWSISLAIQKGNSEEIRVHLSNSRISQNYPSTFLLYMYIESRDYILFHSNNRNEVLSLIDRIYDDYERNMEELDALLVEVKKEQKVHEIAQTSIRTIVPSIMAKTNHEWNLVEEDARSVLQIKLKHGKMMEISLGHKSFSDKIPEMLKVIEQIENLLETIPYPVDIKNCGRKIRWEKNGGV